MRIKLFAAMLAFTTALTPVPAHAGIVEAIIGLISTISASLGVSIVGQALIGQFLYAAVGSIGAALASAVLSFALNALFAPEVPQPTPQQTQSNFALEEAPRFWLMGRQRHGGSVLFAQTKAGRIYKLIAHADTEIISIVDTYLNDVPVTLDGGNYSIDPEFSVGASRYYRLYTRAGTSGQAAQAQMTANFTEWTAQHRGAGVADTLMICDPVPQSHRSVILKHRGVLGLGEPDVTLDAYWGRYYDPRNDSTRAGGSGPERVDNRATWGPANGNIALMIATHRMDPERFANEPEDINWDNIASQADICDETVIDRYGNSIPRYYAGITVNKKEESNIGTESRLLAACDGTRWTDDDGRFCLFVGQYEADPVLVLSDDDIFEIESRDGDDGESLSTHYFMSYTEPAFGMKGTQSAEYAVPGYVSGDTIRMQEIQCYPVLHHNHAYRILKAGVERQIERLRVGLVCGLRGLGAKQRRFLRLDVADPYLAGVYEIGQCDDSYDGLRVQITLIRCDTDRWNLLPGQEGARPNQSISVTVDTTLANIAPANMSISPASVQVETATGARLVAVFTVPTRGDILVEIQHRLKTTTLWENFAVRTEDGAGASSLVPSGRIQECRWRTTTFGGSASDWSAIIEVLATADVTPPAAHIATGGTGGVGTALLTWTAPNSANYGLTRIYRASGAGAPFGSAITVRDEPGFYNSTDNWTDTGLAAGPYTYWLEPLNRSEIAGPRSAAIGVTVT